MNAGDVGYMLQKLDDTILGGMIIQIIANAGDAPDSYGFKVMKPNNEVYVVWVDKDPEGNGAGWLDIKEEG